MTQSPSISASAASSSMPTIDSMRTGIEEQRLAAILGMGAHQRMDAGRWQLAAAFLSEMAQRTRTIFAQINTQGLQAGDTKPTEVPTEAPPPRETQVTETQAPEAAGAPSENPNL
jgi:hypothetical protein